MITTSSSSYWRYVEGTMILYARALQLVVHGPLGTVTTYQGARKAFENEVILICDSSFA